MDELYCLEEVEKPVSIKPCDEEPCFYSWYTSEWSQVGYTINGKAFACIDVYFNVVVRENFDFKLVNLDHYNMTYLFAHLVIT